MKLFDAYDSIRGKANKNKTFPISYIGPVRYKCSFSKARSSSHIKTKW